MINSTNKKLRIRFYRDRKCLRFTTKHCYQALVRDVATNYRKYMQGGISVLRSWQSMVDVRPLWFGANINN